MEEINIVDYKKEILLLIRIDANRLMERIEDRYVECVKILALKRNREHFKEIFYSRFFDLSIKELSITTEDVIRTCDAFYNLIEELKWYLDYTEDLPQMIEDKGNRLLSKLRKSYDLLILTIDDILESFEEEVKEEVEVEEEVNYIGNNSNKDFDNEEIEKINDESIEIELPSLPTSDN